MYGPFWQAVCSNDFAQCPSMARSIQGTSHSSYGAICKTPTFRRCVCGRFEILIWPLLKTAIFGVPSWVAPASVAALWRKIQQKRNSSHLSALMALDCYLSQVLCFKCVVNFYNPKVCIWLLLNNNCHSPFSLTYLLMVMAKKRKKNLSNSIWFLWISENLFQIKEVVKKTVFLPSGWP